MKRIKQHLSQTDVFSNKNRQARIELVAGLLVLSLITALCISADIELVESFYHFTRAYESMDLDEILLFILWLALGSIFYAVRRFSDHKELTRYVAELAYHDRLTGLANRTMAFEHLAFKIKSDRSHQMQLAVLFIDFDNLKSVNDQCGHAAGDELIYKVANLLKNQISSDDMLCRIGGDEFLCFVDLNRGRSYLDELLKKLMSCQKQPFMIEGQLLSVQFSVGVSLYPEHGTSAEALIQAADTAMYHVKSKGKSNFSIFDQDLGACMKRRRYLENSLRNADFDREISVLFQPQINTSSSDIVTYEVLARWYHEGELINPSEFVDVAEQLGTIRFIDLCVLNKAIKETKIHLPDHAMISINISVVEFNQEQFVSDIRSILSEHNFPPHRLELEITETALVSDFDVVANKLSELKALGIKVAIDDFGVGYSSLARLKDLHVDKLKVDRSFITDIETNDKQQAVVNVILALAHHLKLSVVIEGVETRDQLEVLQGFGCETIQGFYFCRPIGVDAASKFKVPSQKVLNPLSICEDSLRNYSASAASTDSKVSPVSGVVPIQE